MRAVVDPNVIISALLSRAGSPAQVLLAWQQGRFELVISNGLLEELRRALAYPKLVKRIPPEDAEEVLRWLARSATVVAHPADDPPLRSEDPGDDYLIALAAAERAALVSGDRHLLALAGRIPVYSSAEFLQLL